MEYYRCANDCFGYCVGEPVFNVKPDGGHCKYNPEECYKHQTLLQSIERQLNDVKARVKDWSQNKHFVKQLADFEKVKKEAKIKGIVI